MSAVSASYAPAGAALISATVLGQPERSDDELQEAVREQLAGWFGAEVWRWKHLRTYRIWHALPDQAPAALEPAQRPVNFGSGLFICGDHRDNASIQGAMSSGWRTANAILASWN